MRLINRFFKNKENRPWSHFEYFNPKWKARIQAMSAYLEHEKSVLDLGCGKMWLKKYLKSDVLYYGCDYVKRDNQTLVCDFLNYEFPEIKTDVCFASGIIEYIEDLNWFFDQIKNTSACIICSYCSLDLVTDMKARKKQGWKNHLSSSDLTKIIQSKGFKLEKQSFVGGNAIYRFTTIA